MQNALLVSIVLSVIYVQFNGMVRNLNIEDYLQNVAPEDDVQVFSSTDCTGSTADSGLHHL